MSRKTNSAQRENDGFGTFFGPAKVVVFRRSKTPLAESEGKAPRECPKEQHKPSSKGVEKKPRPLVPPVLQVDEKRKRLKASRDFSFLDDNQLCPPPPYHPRPHPSPSSSPFVHPIQAHSARAQAGSRSTAGALPLKPVLSKAIVSQGKSKVTSGASALGAPQTVAVRGRTAVAGTKAARLLIEKSKSTSSLSQLKDTTPVRRLLEAERRQSRLAPSVQNHPPPNYSPASKRTTAKRRRAESHSNDDSLEHRGGSPLASVISLLRRSHPQNHRDEYESDEDDRGMEANWATIRAEEARSARLGHKEDERERKLEEGREARRLKRLKERDRG